MNTLIESINKITEIKSDLNAVLRANGLEGGDVFTDYPDKFRELFRVMTVLSESAATGYKAPETTVITDVPAPTLSQYQNIVTVVNNLDEATIYYYIKTDSGNNERGLTSLEKGQSIVVYEPSTVFVYAQYRAEKSPTVSIYVPWQAEIIPEPPVIVRDGTTVTITCNEGDVIYYKIDGDFVPYEGPLTVQRYEDVYAFAQNYRGKSDIIIDEAPEKPVAPEVPEISCSLNVVTITCVTEGATIYYKRITDQYFTEYTGPFQIDRSGVYVAKSLRYGMQSDEVSQYCPYVAAPEPPIINVSNNTVYITCPTSGVTIWYKINDGEYQEYTGPINLTETVNITTYASNDSFNSTTVTQTCTYVEPEVLVPAVPTFSCSNNIVYITCSTANATIWYREVGGNEWIRYTGPIDITEDKTYEAYSSKNGYNSELVTYTAQYVEPVVVEIPNAPVFIQELESNIITITCSTPNAVIWYRNINDVDWTTYTDPITITEDTTFVAYSYKNNQASETVTYTAVYTPDIVIPDAPTIAQVGNVVGISCATEGAIIWYRIDYGGWIRYYNPFSISSDINVETYSELNGQVSTTVSKDLYVVRPAAPVISKMWNNITITQIISLPIYYSLDGENYTLYTEPFDITETVTVYAYTIYDNIRSTISSLLCVYNADYAYYTQYLTFEILEDGRIGWYRPQGTNNALTLYYKKNNEEWKPINSSYSYGGLGSSFTVNTGDIIKFKGNNYYYNSLISSRINNHFTSSCQFNVYGNIASLVYGDDFINKYEDYFDHNFNWGSTGSRPGVKYLPPFILGRMFSGCTKLVSVENLVLPWEKVSAYMYFHMFFGCTSLTDTPKFHATELSGQCYYGMFWGCTSLQAAEELPATSFKSKYWYSTTVYSNISHPQPYAFMFKGCTLLHEITCKITDFEGSSVLQDWVDGVSSIGTFVKSAGVEWPTGNSGIPEGWNVIESS